MKIYFNGDSHTYGSELIDPNTECYSYKLAQLLNATILDNPAVGGAGNDRILRTTEEFLQKCNGNYPDLIVIGWSEATRFDWFYDGQYRTMASTQDGLSDETARSVDMVRNEFQKTTMYSMTNSVSYTQYFHSQIYNLHCKLDYLKIPHLFFMGVHPLTDPYAIFKRIVDDFDIHYKKIETILGKDFCELPKLDWNNSFWKPYDKKGSFLDWGLDNGYQETIFHHLPKEAHTEFSLLLRDYLYENNIIS